MSYQCKSKPELSIPCICLNLSKVKGFSEINLELMDPQNQVKVETMLPDFSFQDFWHLCGWCGVQVTLPSTMSIL